MQWLTISTSNLSGVPSWDRFGPDRLRYNGQAANAFVPSLAVNAESDVLIGFNEVAPNTCMRLMHFSALVRIPR